MNTNFHITAEEKLAKNTEASVQAISETGKKIEETTRAVKEVASVLKDKSVETTGFTGLLNSGKKANETLEQIKGQSPKVVQKLEEVKSASLISNKLLKEIRDKEIPEPKEFPSKMKVEIEGISVLTLKGDEGHTPTDNELVALIKPLIPIVKDGHTPTDSELLALIRPLIPKVKDGETPSDAKLLSLIKPLVKDGYTPKKGVDYDDGKDGSPDTPEEVVAKVNSSKKKIRAEQVVGLPDVLRAVDEIGKYPMGKEAGGGGNVIRWLSNGVVVSAHVTEINFSTNITPVYDGNGRLTLTASGTSTTYTETPVGAIDGSNVTYTTANTITTVLNMAINGQFIHPSQYTVSGAGFTMGTALDASLSGTGFTIVYQ